MHVGASASAGAGAGAGACTLAVDGADAVVALKVNCMQTGPGHGRHGPVALLVGLAVFPYRMSVSTTRGSVFRAFSPRAWGICTFTEGELVAGW